MSLKNLDLSVLKNQDVDLLHGPLKKQKLKQKESEPSAEYVYIGNIPQTYKSADLRFFFKKCIEKETFECFHYRHRPETQVIIDAKDDTTDKNGRNTTLNETCCCIVSIYSSHVEQFIHTYHGKEWRDRKLTFLRRTANIRKLKPKTKPLHSSNTSTTYVCRGETKEENTEKQLYKEDLEYSIELNPPQFVLPQGNVGTPSKYFDKLIQECKMPPSLIKSLDLQFPRCGKRKKYSNVPPVYDEVEAVKPPVTTSRTAGSPLPMSDRLSTFEEETVHFIVHPSTPDRSTITETSPNEVTIGSVDLIHSSTNTDKTIDEPIAEPANLTELEFRSESLPHKRSRSPTRNESEGCTNWPDDGTRGSGGGEEDESDEEENAEDWERHETLHDDVPNQLRLKERLFEEDMEVVWEKGGSGLVFYTDAYAWNEMKGKDFDADTVDDWDVDYSVYYEDGAGDKSARDQLQMRLEAQRRRGKVGPSKPSQLRSIEKRNQHRMKSNFAEFEKYSNAFGSRILKKQGWIQGCGVGSSREGICEPISGEGHKPYERTGLGYYGEKLERNVGKRKRKVVGDVEIRTVYDEEGGSDQKEDLLRFQGLEQLKYYDKRKETKPK